MHRMRPPDGRRPGLADAEKAHLALADELAHRADRVLDRNGRIDPMDVIEVDDVGLEPPEALLAGFAHIFRPAVREARVAEQPEIAKLARDDVIAAVPSDRLGYELLVAAAAVAVGGIEKIDADLARPPDRRDPRGAVGLAVEWGHRAAAETDGRNLQLPKPATLHAVPPNKSARAGPASGPFPVAAGQGERPRIRSVDRPRAHCLPEPRSMSSWGVRRSGSPVVIV